MLRRKITGRSRSDAFDSRFNGRLILRQLTNPNFTWRELLNISLLSGRYFRLVTALYSPAEVHLGSSKV